MILGLDVGGTQTDAVLIQGNRVVAHTKTPTGDHLLETLRRSLESTLVGGDPGRIDRMAFSTTMATNAIVQDRLEPTAMIVSAGPGMDPGLFALGPSYHVVEGCLDHQGFEALPVNKASVLQASEGIQREGINTVGVVTKFSTRNPAHELQIQEWVGSAFSHVALGHRSSGVLNFPRRIATTYLNAALHGLHQTFSQTLIQILDEQGLQGPRFLLKPDGGTIELEKSGNAPCRTAQSGPAASVMGALALDGCHDTCLVLDIGGTTTDMAVVLNGIPLRAPFGIRLAEFRTLIRSLLTRSIGLGGDSEVRIEQDGVLKIGPLRRGKPVAFGGPAPTPTDAMVTLELLDQGDREAATKAIDALGRPLGWEPRITAERILEEVAQGIAESARAFLHYINSRPVYTIYEVLQEEKVEPASVVIIGGPAPQLAPYVGKALGLPPRVPPHSGVANAIGAAVARVTFENTLHADTERGTVIIPEADLEESITHRFTVDDALALARETLKRQAVEMGADPESLDISVIQKQVFNMIRGFSRTGRNIRLKTCITPGLIPEWQRGR